MSDPALALKNKLEIDGDITNGFVGRAPANFDDVYSVFSEAGGNSNPKYLRDHTTIVCNVYGKVNDYPSGRTEVQTVKDALLGVKPFTVGNVIYARVVMTNDIQFLGYDENERPIFSLTFEVTRDYTASGDSNREVIE